DLWAANRHALRESGVPAAQIHTTTFPTGPTPQHSTTPPPPSTPPTTPPPPPPDPPPPVPPSSPADRTSPGDFFSDRAARPCGRLALVARLRTPGQNSMDVTT